MQLERQTMILKNIIQQYEDMAEGAIIELKICVKVKDEVGAEPLRKRALELESKVNAAKAMLVELEAQPKQKEGE